MHRVTWSLMKAVGLVTPLKLHAIKHARRGAVRRHKCSSTCHAWQPPSTRVLPDVRPVLWHAVTHT